MKTIKSLFRKINWTRGLTGIALMAVLFCISNMHTLAAEGTIAADTAKIRATASTDSEVVGSTVKGKTIDILEAVKDSAGTVWYKVSVSGGGYGYIRGDLVQTSGDIEITATASQTTTDNTSNETTQEPAATVPTAIGEQAATIQAESVRIRSGASTAHSTVASLPKGTAITLIGEANDSAGNKWYQMTCTYNNKSIEGYVRSDLIAIGSGDSAESEGTEGGEAEGTESTEGGEGTEAAEGETPEGEEAEGGETAPEETVNENNDYEVVYRQDEAGEYYYYLYDNVNGTMQKVDDLFSTIGTANERITSLKEQADTEKIIIIILAVVIVILIVVVTILLFKIRELYYEDYDEEDEEEEEEEEPAPVKKRVKRTAAEEEEPIPVRKKKSQTSPSAGQGKTRQSAADEPRTKERNGELRGAQKKEQPEKQTPKTSTRKAQNFLVDDDEFEFEFLNMDDKDL